MDSRNRNDNSTNVVLLVVGGIFACFVLLIAVCGGLFYLFSMRLAKSVEGIAQAAAEQAEKMADAVDAEAAAQAFLIDISTGQTERAYGQTTQGYQTRRRLAEFTAHVAQHPALRNQNIPQPAVPTPVPANDRVTVRLSLNGGVGVADVVTMDMLRENGQWKVDQFVAP